MTYLSFRSLLAAGFGCTILAGAAHAASGGLTVLGTPAVSSAVSFEVALPLRNTDQLETLLTALHNPASASYHKWLTPAQFAMRFGPDAATMQKVSGALRGRGFAVEVHSRSLHVSGSVDLVQKTLGMNLQVVRTATNSIGTRIVADRAAQLPPELAAAGATVMSFGRQEAHVMSQRISDQPLAAGVDNRQSPDGGYWFTDLKQAYQYPSYQTMVTVNGTTQRLDGTGATIGILMSSDYFPADVKTVFEHEKFAKLSGQPTPALYKDIAIDGGGGLTGGASFEVALDTQMEITGAPGAHVILYDIPDLSDGNIFAGYVTAVEANEVDLISSSFGGCELDYFPAYNAGQDYRGVLRAYHELFQQGNAQGITFLASSGDSAGKECTSVPYATGAGNGHFAIGVSSPANDPNVTAVGGSNLVTKYHSGSLDSAYATENAWSDPEVPYDVYGTGFLAQGGVWGAGGGISRMWAMPHYQSLVTTENTMRRSLPDVGMQVGGCPGGISKIDKKTQFCDGGNNPADGNGNADRSYVFIAYAVKHGGGLYGVIGTSVSSPEFASAMALLIEQKGRMGNLNEYLYQTAAMQAKQGIPTEFFHTGIPGYNGVIQSNLSPDYNVSTGVGTPVVSALVGVPAASPAGVPQTASNP